MPNIDIHTTLAFCPKPKKHEITVITRGATAVLDFDLYGKVYDFNDIDQLTVLFEQSGEILYYNMVQRYALTGDTLAILNKKYYNRVDANLGVSKYKFEPADIQMGGNPEGLYEEIVTDELVPMDENWQVDPHFSVSRDGK